MALSIPSVFSVIGHNSIKASWEAVPTKSGFTVRYQLFDCEFWNWNILVYTYYTEFFNFFS